AFQLRPWVRISMGISELLYLAHAEQICSQATIGLWHIVCGSDNPQHFNTKHGCKATVVVLLHRQGTGLTWQRGAIRAAGPQQPPGPTGRHLDEESPVIRRGCTVLEPFLPAFEICHDSPS